MFGIGGWEFLLIAGIALLLFGPDKLPQFARTIGRLLRDFKRYQDLMESTFRAEMYSIDNPLVSDTFKKGKEFRERVQSGEFEQADDTTAGDGPAPEAGDGRGAAAGEAGAVPDEGGETDAPSASAASAESDPSDGGAVRESASADAPPVRRGLPEDHPLHDAYEAGADIGIDDDIDLSALDESDLGWVPGREAPGEEGADEA